MGWNNNGGILNPFGLFGGQLPNVNIDNLYAQYKQAQAQMQAQMNNMNAQPSVNINPAMGQRGTWLQVRDYKEVENYPVPTDGTPTLFFDFEHGMFYSKKFANGQCCIQDFYFGPTSGMSEKEQAIPEPSIESQSLGMNFDPSIFNVMFEKMDDIAKSVSALSKKIGKSKTSEGE